MNLSLSDIIVAGLEIFFIIWTIKNVRKISEMNSTLEQQKEKIDQLYRERTEDFNKMERLKDEVEILKKNLKQNTL